MITYNKFTTTKIIEFKEYNYNYDYYRLWSVIYYLIFKKYPSFVKLKNKITNIEVNYEDVKNYSKNCIDFMNKLIISEPKKRIGFKDINELKSHSWFLNFDWNKLKKKKLDSPFKLIKNEIDQKKCRKLHVCDKYLIRYKSLSKTSLYKILIKKFDYVNIRIIN